MTLPPFDAPPPPPPEEVRRAAPPAAPPPSAPPPRQQLPTLGRLGRGLVTGVLAASATAGAVLGFGWRLGTPARGFNAIAGVVLGDRAQGVWGWVSTVTLTGIVVHAAVMVGWGLLFAYMVGRARGWRLVAMALVVAAGALVVSVAVVARRSGADTAAVLGPGQLVGVHLVLAVALAVGMRFARSTPGSDSERRAAQAGEP